MHYNYWKRFIKGGHIKNRKLDVKRIETQNSDGYFLSICQEVIDGLKINSLTYNHKLKKQIQKDF